MVLLRCLFILRLVFQLITRLNLTHQHYFAILHFLLFIVPYSLHSYSQLSWHSHYYLIQPQ